MAGVRRRSSSAPPPLTTAGAALRASQQVGILGGPSGGSGMDHSNLYADLSNPVQLPLHVPDDDVFGDPVVSAASPPLTTAGAASRASQQVGILGSPQRGQGMSDGVVVMDTANAAFPVVAGDVLGAAIEDAGVKVDARGRAVAECGCLVRTLPPKAAVQPPFELVPGNVERVEQWFKEEYASSTFNVCEHQPLPMMSGAPPMRIIMKEGATPVALH